MVKSLLEIKEYKKALSLFNHLKSRKMPWALFGKLNPIFYGRIGKKAEQNFSATNV